MKKLIPLILLFYSCSPVWHLKQAVKHEKKAIEKGADVKYDSIKQTHRFELKGAKTSINFSTINPVKTVTQNSVIFKDTTIYKDKIKTIFKDNIIEIECPDSIVTKDVTVGVNKKISAGRTEFQYYTGVIGAVIFGLIIGYFVRMLSNKGVTIVNNTPNQEG